MENLESDGNGVWATQTRPYMSVWHGWLAVVLSLDRNVLTSDTLCKIDDKPLLTGRSAETHTVHYSFVVRDAESPEYFSIVRNEFSAHPYPLLRSSP